MQEVMTKDAIEALLPSSFWKIHETVSKILQDNNIRKSQEESKVDQLPFIVKTVMKLLTMLIFQNTKD